jgi:PAS domain S-box-containing protein
MSSDSKSREAAAAEGDLYRLIAESSSDWEYLEDPDGRMLWVSPSCEPITGHSPEEFLKDQSLLSAIVHPEDRALFESHKSGCRGCDRLDETTFRILRPDGGVTWIGHRCRPIRLPGGTVPGRRCSNREITDLKMSEERYRTLFESMKEAFVVGEMIYDDAGKPSDFQTLSVNPAFTDLTDLPADRVVGRTVREVIPGFEPFWIEALGRVVMSGIGERVEGPVSELGRNYEAFAWRSSPGCFAVVFNDITERKKAEEKLRLQEAALESAGSGVVITGRDGTIQWVNPAFSRLTGYSAEEAIGKNPRVVKSGRHDAAFYKALWDTILAGRLWHGEIVNKRRDGALYTEEMTIAPVLDAGGSITHFVAIKQDVTERKKAEERLRELNETLERRVAERTAEAERRAVQLRAFASELSQAERTERLRLASALHDQLQQILVAAKLNLAALEGRLGDETQRSDVLKVAQLLDESITWCRSVTVSLSPPILQEAGLAGGLGWLARQLPEQHGLQVNLSVGEGWVEPADADLKAFLFEAVRELLFNVAKHSGETAARVVVHQEDGSFEIRVEDDGTGFDPAARREEVQAGGRFGLFSIQQRLEVMGGSMSVESAPGQGTRVTLLAFGGPFPATAAAVAAQPAGVVPKEAPGSVAVRSGRIRVLIADDHRIFRQGLIALLRAEGGLDVVGEAADGAEAVELARTLRPDVIIMDVAMPNLNGVEATRQIVAELPGLRIIGLSMHEDETIAASMREAGAVAFLTKGGPSDALIAAIHAAFSGGVSP